MKLPITRQDDTVMLGTKDITRLEGSVEYQADVLVRLTDDIVVRKFAFIEDILTGTEYLVDTITGSLYSPLTGQCRGGALRIISEITPTGRLVPDSQIRGKEAEISYLNKQGRENA